MRTSPTVLVISNHGDIVGGGEISLLTLLKGLDRSRWAPIVVVPAEGTVAAAARALGLPVQIVPLPPIRHPSLACFRSIAMLRRVIRGCGACLVHANGSRAMFYAGLAGRLLRTPVIWHIRILEPDRPLDWLLVRLATRSIAISEAVRRRLAPWPAALERCVVVPNGLDLDGFVPSAPPAAVRSGLSLGPGDRAIGTVGRLVPFKGHRHLLDAFARLRHRYPELHVLVVGDGPERGPLEEQASRLGVAKAVRFTGHREDVADLLTVMEVFVLPSLAEHFGRVILEAMAVERPVVATSAGGVPEIVVDNVTGLLVPPADPEALANATATLLADSTRARLMGKEGRRRVEEHYSLPLHAERIEAVYAEVV
jgi:glycosyltransferase involved in cell wall biosynthesis